MDFNTYDLKIENVSILDVFNGEFFSGSICVSGKRIASLTTCRAKRVLDGRGMIAAPAFFDSHMHVEATMLVPWELARILIPHGTLELMMDPHEVGNVAGMDGIRFLVSLFEGVPIHPLVQVPSRVPSAPGLETAGHHLGPEEVAELLREAWAVSLGELNYQNALSGKEEYLRKIETALSMGKVVNGHAPGLRPPELDAYAALGIGDDHESVEPWEVVEKLRRGIWILV
ncbi:MAG: adenine deaminase, partial [Thermoplasmata archaeon]